MNEIQGYYLFWNEEENRYYLMDSGEVVGVLLDDTKFAIRLG